MNKPSESLQLPEAILFDLDGTLYDYDVAHRNALEKIQEKFVRQFSLNTLKVKQAYDSARQTIKGRLGNTAASHNRLLYFQTMIELLGLEAQPLLALEMEQTYWRNFLASAPLYDNVKELFDDLRLAGIKTGLVTDLTANIQFRKLVYFGLDSNFNAIVTSEETGRDKPHAENFRLLVNKLGVKPAAVWMVGDNPSTDIVGAKEALNCVTLLKLRAGEKVRSDGVKPDLVFTEFKDLVRLLNKLLGRLE